MIIKSPSSDQEWELYYQLRYIVLREPWNQPKGSEILVDESKAIHAIAVEDEKVIGVARLHESGPQQGQVRCVAVAMDQQGKGVGKKLMDYLEQRAKELNIHEIVLEARENAVPFYESIGYSTIKESYLLFGKIQHYAMNKQI